MLIHGIELNSKSSLGNDTRAYGKRRATYIYILLDIITYIYAAAWTLFRPSNLSHAAKQFLARPD